MKKGFMNFLNKYNPDILLLQEIKTHEAYKLLNVDYNFYWNFAKKKGYAGTAIFSKIKPISSKEGIGIQEFDDEGRVLTLEFKDFFVVNIYAPHSRRDLSREEFKKKWAKTLIKFLKSLNKPVICGGDFNVAHEEIDLARPKDNKKNAGFTDFERKDFSKLLNEGFTDTFRLFNKKPEHYTWWSYMHNAREKNIGWRVDYFLTSKKIKPKSASILSKVMGSDHCPIVLEL